MVFLILTPIPRTPYLFKFLGVKIIPFESTHSQGTPGAVEENEQVQS